MVQIRFCPWSASRGHSRLVPNFKVNAKLSDAWSVSFSGAWTDSKLTTPNASYTNFLTGVATRPDGVTPPCTVGSSCTVPIMNVVKDTASLTLTYSTEALSGYNLTASTADSYTGTSHDVAYYFDYQLPSYSIANARVNLAHDNWSTNLFVDNLTNKVALTTANNTSFQFNIPQLVRYSTNQPTSRGPRECRLITSFDARRIYGAGFISTGGEPSSPPSVSRCTA